MPQKNFQLLQQYFRIDFFIRPSIEMDEKLAKRTKEYTPYDMSTFYD